MRRSTKGRSAFAFASVVTMPSERTNERARPLMSAVLWRFTRPSFLLRSWCLINILLSQCEAEIRKCAFDILQTLLTQALYRKKVVFAFAYQAAHGTYGRVVERILNALRKVHFRYACLEHLRIHSTLILARRDVRCFDGADLRALLFFEPDD